MIVRDVINRVFEQEKNPVDTVFDDTNVRVHDHYQIMETGFRQHIGELQILKTWIRIGNNQESTPIITLSTTQCPSISIPIHPKAHAILPASH